MPRRGIVLCAALLLASLVVTVGPTGAQADAGPLQPGGNGSVWQLDHVGRASYGSVIYFGQVTGLNHVTSIASAPGSSTIATAGMQALRDDGTVWSLDATRVFGPVYGLNGIKVIGGSTDTSYGIS